MYKCTNCDWQGENLSKQPLHRLAGKCPVCGDEINSLNDNKPVKQVDLDLNGDGKIDSKDATIASKVMNAVKRKKKSKKKKSNK